jgi:hypothetical protein|uniref:Uncharacterized protein n=1 Tax=Eutreptiella gymnastica TaxID=73025 RepID=A0A7S4FYY4_9EUGL|mmetsp:Transcript_31125/g.50412  ORF Transcript_31125/g.50412 Transcript_31125/m.50412 type:complete len:107 (+) Transcript_31125:320-640(+)
MLWVGEWHPSALNSHRLLPGSLENTRHRAGDIPDLEPRSKRTLVHVMGSTVAVSCCAGLYGCAVPPEKQLQDLPQCRRPSRDGLAGAHPTISLFQNACREVQVLRA